jgi:NAD(P)-dependent dehydrogenase (short-subunit alcohol dehydrogenase family)
MDEHWRPEYDFSNKVVLITGGTGALGRTIIQAFVACKSAVIS